MRGRFWRSLAGAAGWAGLAAATAATPALAAPTPPEAPAASCPGGAVRIIVPVVAGGPMDRLARGLAAELARSGAGPHVVENRSGGMTIPAWDAVAKAAPDGCTLLIASTSGRTVLRWQVDKLPYDPATALRAVTPLAEVPQLFVAHPAAGIRSLAELVRKAGATPGGVSIAIPTPGAMTHLAAVALQRVAGIQLNEIPYRGGAPAALAVRAGEVAVMSADVGSVLPSVKAGELLALATASAQRLPQLPEVPTVAEAGFGALEASHAYALFVPAGLSADRLERLFQRVRAALAREELAEPLRAGGMRPRTLPPAQFEAELRGQERRYEAMARAARQ